jgi:16S rRNA (guanine527-N7)-methyltransferase
VFHVKRADRDLADAARNVGVTLESEQVARLRMFEELLAGRAVDLGMVARADRDRVRERHVLDSLRAATVVADEDRAAFDVGSGAGLPGIPVALARRSLHVRLIEPRRARVAFLELAIERLALENVAVVHGRIEDLADQVDLCFTRAFAPIDEAWNAALRVLRPGGRLVYFAGAGMPVADRPPGAASLEIVPAPAGSLIESGGPLVIMTR